MVAKQKAPALQMHADVIRDTEENAAQELFALCKGNISEMARIWGVTRTFVYKVLARAGLTAEKEPE